MEILFIYLLAFNCNSVIKLYFNGFALCGILIDMAISSNEKSRKIKNISSTTCPTIMALPGDSIAIAMSDCYEFSSLHKSFI